MDLRRITSLIIKLIAIFILAKSVGSLPLFIDSLSTLWAGKPDPFLITNTIIAVSVPTLYVLFYAVLIMKSDLIANRLVPDNDNDISINIDYKFVQNIVFCAIGLIVLADAIPKLA